MIVGGVDFIMLLSDWFLERREKRIQTAKEEGRKEGYAEGYAAAKAENGDAVEESLDSPSKSSNSPPKPSKKS
jgi:flagellar biosynthesis/type III secretory pathway protein FliH